MKCRGRCGRGVHHRWSRQSLDEYVLLLLGLWSDELDLGVVAHALMGFRGLCSDCLNALTGAVVAARAFAGGAA